MGAKPQKNEARFRPAFSGGDPLSATEGAGMKKQGAIPRDIEHVPGFLFFMAKTIYITGGARSGKSAFALQRASALGGRRAFIATARVLDSEMKARIELHKKERGGDWDTFEEPLDIAGLCEKIAESYDAILIDCMTLWLMSITEAGLDGEKEAERLAGIIREGKGASVIIVSNEIGMGIVPMDAMTRQFRDCLGKMNGIIASASDEAWLVVSGIPLKLR